MEAFLYWLAVGCVAWIASGIDDALSVITFTRTNGIKTAVSVMMGAVLGLITVFLASVALSQQLLRFDRLMEYRWLAGFIPISIGLYTLREIWWRPEKQLNLESRVRHPLTNILFTWGIYITNTADDAAVDMTLILQTHNHPIKLLALFAGNLIGCMTVFMIGVSVFSSLAGNIKKAVYTIAAVAVIAIGLGVILSHK